MALTTSFPVPASRSQWLSAVLNELLMTGCGWAQSIVGFHDASKSVEVFWYIENIEWNVSKRGVLVPRIKLKPIKIN